MNHVSVARMERDEAIDLPPGFRFHPTDEELLTYYLSVKVKDSSFRTRAIGEADLNKVEPWELPWKAKLGEKEWYFFCMKDRKYPTGLRVNRATEAGYWKATGKDRKIFKGKFFVGMKKTLVFYKGRAPKGEKTNWVMHEYRLDGTNAMRIQNTTHKNEWVICRIFKKTSGGGKVHISGLIRIPTSGGGSGSSSESPELPSLMEMSTEPIGQHVTCFSNQMEAPLHKNSYISPITKQNDIGYNICDMTTVFENQELSVTSLAPLDLDSLWDF